jgi:putative glutamine amidotransferase
VNIGITQRVDKIGGREELRDALDQRLVKWVVETKNTPIPIPNILADTKKPINNQVVIERWLEALDIEAILISGGNDIGDVEQRDLTENFLLLWAEKNRKPVLGICHGMQMMGVYAGGKLRKVEGHVRTRHQLTMKDNYKIKTQESVNSYHNMALESCPNQFEILATSEDGSIEAMKHKELPWEGWMWHPERESCFSNIDQVRFKNLINDGKQ